MTQYELIDRLCNVNSLLCDIVKEQSALIAQHDIEPIVQDSQELSKLYEMKEKAETENNLIEAELRRY